LGVPRGNVVRLQIAVQAKVLRVNRASFNEWLHSRGLPATVIIKQLVEKMGAKDYRKTLGGGTGFGGGTGHVLDIPLTGRLADIANPISDDEVAAMLRKSPADATK